MACVPLMREMVSLDSSTRGLICARLRASALGIRVPFSSKHSPSPMRARARCASGARSPLAPTLPCDGTMGVTPRLSISQSVSMTTARDSRVTLGERIRPQQHHGARFCDGERFAYSDRMRAHQVDLQFANLIAGDAHVAQFAHASRDRVSEFVAGNNFVDDGARLIDGLSRVWRKQRSTAFGWRPRVPLQVSDRFR